MKTELMKTVLETGYTACLSELVKQNALNVGGVSKALEAKRNVIDKLMEQIQDMS